MQNRRQNCSSAYFNLPFFGSSQEDKTFGTEWSLIEYALNFFINGVFLFVIVVPKYSYMNFAKFYKYVQRLTH